MSTMFFSYVLPLVHVLACLFLIVVVLLQTGKGADMGAVLGGGSQTLFGASGAGNLLTKLTTGMAITFMATSLLIVVGQQRRPSSSLLDRIPQAPPAAAPEMPPPPAAPNAANEAAPMAPANAPAGVTPGVIPAADASNMHVVTKIVPAAPKPVPSPDAAPAAGAAPDADAKPTGAAAPATPPPAAPAAPAPAAP